MQADLGGRGGIKRGEGKNRLGFTVMTTGGHQRKEEEGQRAPPLFCLSLSLTCGGKSGAKKRRRGHFGCMWRGRGGINFTFSRSEEMWETGN